MGQPGPLPSPSGAPSPVMPILRTSEALSSTLTRHSHFARPVLWIETSGGFSDAFTSLNEFLGPNDRVCRGLYPHSQLLNPVNGVSGRHHHFLQVLSVNCMPLAHRNVAPSISVVTLMRDKLEPMYSVAYHCCGISGVETVTERNRDRGNCFFKQPYQTFKLGIWVTGLLF